MKNCLSQDAFRDADTVLVLVRALGRTHINLHCSETFFQAALCLSVCYNVFNMYLRAPEALQQSGSNHSALAGGVIA